MKTVIALLVSLSLPLLVFSQVGINNTNPNASLDITASNVATPSNTDGILIPRVDEFPATNPTASQDGMMVFATGVGVPAKGFYYWDNGATSWVAVSGGSSDADWFEENTTVAPTSNAADIFTDGNVGIGINNVAYPLQIESPSSLRTVSLLNEGVGTSVTGIYNRLNESAAATSGSASGIVNNITRSNQSGISGVSNSFQNATVNVGFAYLYGYQNSFGTSTSNTTFGLINRFQGTTNTAYGVHNIIGGPMTTFYGVNNNNIAGATLSGDFYGLHNSLTGSDSGDRYGVYTSLAETGSGDKYGEYISIPTTAGGTHYGVYADVQDSAGYAGYFLGRTSMGAGTINRYLMPLADGTSGQVMTSDGAGQISFSTPSTGVEKIDDLTDGKSDSDGSNDGSSIFLGVNAGQADDATNNRNVGIGYRALNNNTIGEGNIALGYQSLFDNINGDSNIAIGRESLRNNTSGDDNIGLGLFSLYANTIGLANIALGSSSLSSNTIGSSNIAIGSNSLQLNISGESNIAMGYTSLRFNTTGTHNTAFGFMSLTNNTTGSNNIAQGNRSLLNNTSGDNNIALGGSAGLNNIVGSANIFLGVSSGFNETGSNKLYIENSSADADNALIYGEFDNDILRTNGEFQIGNPTGTGYALPTTDGTIGQVMTTDGAGQVSYSTISATDTQNTLDEAYDEGGAGAGAIITATDGAVTVAGEDGFAVTGTAGVGDGITLSGAGSKLFFNPNTGSFRAGQIDGTQWNAANVGDRSVAFGNNNTASGNSSTAIGANNVSSGNRSLTVGDDGVASGQNSVVMGEESDATANNTFAQGYRSTASANASVAMGLQNNAPSWGEMTVGTFATTYAQNSTTSWNLNDRLFTVGNGSGTATRSNALTIYKNGRININDAYDLPIIDGALGQVMTTDGAGQINFSTPTTGAEKIDDLTDGKSDNDGTNDGSSIFFGVNAGNADDSSNNENVGIGYLAMENSTTGEDNVAIGSQTLRNNTSGNNNIALGTVALYSNTTGFQNIAIGPSSLALNTTGRNNVANGLAALYSNTVGVSNNAIGRNAISANTSGSYNQGLGSFALNSNTLGDGNIGIGTYSGSSNVSGDYNVFLGYNAGFFETGSNSLYIENTDANPDNALIYGEFDNDILRTNGEFQIGNPTGTGYALPTVDGTATHVLQTDGTGQISFVDPATFGDGDTQNTLDQAYDEGGAGAGNIINATDGALTINGDDGFIVNSQGLGNGDDIALTGNPILMFFNPKAGAFRTGEGNGTNWDQANLGELSFAQGHSTIASGGRSFAINSGTIASGTNSFAAGIGSTASGSDGAAFGTGNTAFSRSEFVVGRNATTYVPASPTLHNNSDRIFVVGNGFSSATRSNALTIYKNGTFNINDEYNMPLSDGNTGELMQTDGAGQVSFIDPATLVSPDVTVFPFGQMHLSANQTVTGTGWVKMLFATAPIDVGSDFNTTSDRFIVPTNGIYQVDASFHSDIAIIATASFGIAVYVNGSNVKRSQYSHHGIGLVHRDVHAAVNLNANDYVEIWIYKQGTFDINSNTSRTSWEIERVR